MAQRENIVGVKELRNNLDAYIGEIAKGKQFTVVRRSKPVFRIAPIEAADEWVEVADFTTIKKGGVNITDLLSRL